MILDFISKLLSGFKVEIRIPSISITTEIKDKTVVITLNLDEEKK